MNQPREVRIYRYLFSDGTSIEVEAPNRIDARKMINDFVKHNKPSFENKRLEAEYVSKPCRDVTKKVVGDKTYICVGYEASPEDGWLEYGYYQFLRNTPEITGRKIK